MTIRTGQKTVTFRRPFTLGSLDETLPSGDYIIETGEELLEGLSFPAYRRKMTLIHLHANPNRPGCRQALPIDPDELDAALMRDEAADDNPVGADAKPVFERRGLWATRSDK